jgi:hypothetical protein
VLGRALMVDLALSRVPDAALNAYGAGARAVSRVGSIANSTQRFMRGSSAVKMMGRESTRGFASSTVSSAGGFASVNVTGEFFHGSGDRKAALAAIDADFATLQDDILHNAISPGDAAWSLAEIVPTIAAWHDFATRERESMLGAWITEWSAFKQWHAKIIRLRELARARGIALQSPTPIQLPETIWERGERGAGSGLDRAFTLAKWIAYAAIGALGFASLYSALRTTRREIAAEIK